MLGFHNNSNLGFDSSGRNLGCNNSLEKDIIYDICCTSRDFVYNINCLCTKISLRLAKRSYTNLAHRFIKVLLIADASSVFLHQLPSCNVFFNSPSTTILSDCQIEIFCDLCNNILTRCNCNHVQTKMCLQCLIWL